MILQRDVGRKANVCVCLGAALIVLGTIGGCGGGPGTVNGNVMFDGVPVGSGTVTAIGSDNIPRSAALQQDGRFTLKDVPPGRVRVAVESPDPKTVTSFDSDGPAIAPSSVTVSWRKLPEKYANFETSGLAYEIRSGVNPIDIKLQ